MADNNTNGGSVKTPKVFISHNTKDQEFAEALVTLLEGFGFTEEKLFCSSVAGYGVGLSESIKDTLQEQFKNHDLYMIFIHSPRYYQSPVSLNEMGASWVLSSDFCSFLTTDMEFSKMNGVIDSSAISIKVDAEEARDRLFELHDKLKEKFSLRSISPLRLNKKITDFLKEVKVIKYEKIEDTPSKEAIAKAVEEAVSEERKKWEEEKKKADEDKAKAIADEKRKSEAAIAQAVEEAIAEEKKRSETATVQVIEKAVKEVVTEKNKWEKEKHIIVTQEPKKAIILMGVINALETHKLEFEKFYKLGNNYYYGINGVKKDCKKAVELYKKAAEQGHADAQYVLGHCYYWGYGVNVDEEKAVELYKKAVKGFKNAAKQGNADAQLKLGECYYYGHGVEEDEEKASVWYKKAVKGFKNAAKQGNAEAQYGLGDCYYYGLGVKKDEEQAVEWFKKAAEQGNILAKEILNTLE